MLRQNVLGSAEVGEPIHDFLQLNRPVCHLLDAVDHPLLRRHAPRARPRLVWVRQRRVLGRSHRRLSTQHNSLAVVYQHLCSPRTVLLWLIMYPVVDACGLSSCGIWAGQRPPLGSSQVAL